MSATTALIIVGVCVIVVPAAYIVWACCRSRKDKNRAAEYMKNDALANTTVRRQGPNGRTVFQQQRPIQYPAPAVRKGSPPILPTTRQQAEQASRHNTVKKTWNRLSRPFSMGPVPTVEDHIPLKMQPMPYKSHNKPYAAKRVDGPVSPLTAADMHGSSSWKTVYDNAPVSPLSIRKPSAFHSSPTTHSGVSKHFQGIDKNAGSLHTISLTSPPRKGSASSLGFGSSRGFVASSSCSQKKAARQPLTVNTNVRKFVPVQPGVPTKNVKAVKAGSRVQFAQPVKSVKVKTRK